MNGNELARSRRRMGYALAGVTVLGAAWLMAPGLPVLRAPRAGAEEKAAGQALFVRDWQPEDPLAHGDGLGPVFNARSCVACHFQGGVGGGGGNDHNVMAFEALPTKDRREVEGGLIHKFAVANSFLEDHSALRDLYPVITGALRLENGCQVLVRDFDPVRTESVNSTALFGAGWIDRISSRHIVQQSRRLALAALGRELQSDFGGIPAGRYRVLPDGRVGKFGWKAQFATLEEFVAAACANEIGLGNPHREQAKPMVKTPYPDVEADLDDEQFGQLVAFVDTLSRPELVMPEESHARARVEKGRTMFDSIGCAICHTPDVGGVAGIYSDFLLHRLEDRRPGAGTYEIVELPDAPVPIEHPKPDEWKTPPLWGVADSAPYFHDGASSTLEMAIDRHRGDAEPVTDAYRHLPAEDREALLTFLRSLKAPADAEEAPASMEEKRPDSRYGTRVAAIGR